MSHRSLIEIDERVLREDYCNYDLIARYWNEEYRGRIWKNKQRIADREGPSLDEIMGQLRALVDQLQEQKRKSRGKRKPSAKEIASALQGIEPKLSTAQKMMLNLQYRAPNQRISVGALMRLADSRSPDKALEAYCQIAKRLSDELAYRPTLRSKSANSELLLLCKQLPDLEALGRDTALSLRPEIVKAFEISYPAVSGA